MSSPPRSAHGIADRLLVRLRPAGVSARRRLAGLLLAAVLLPSLTAAMAGASGHLALVDELLFYLLSVIGVTLVGGVWPALIAAVAAGLLVNWFFTPPLHTWTIDDPDNLLALLLFVVTAVTVSSVVHLAARRGELARERSTEAEALLALARTVLGDDTPDAVLAHLRASTELTAVLEERVGASWVSIAGVAGPGPRSVLPAGTSFRLVVHGDTSTVGRRVLEGVAVQAASSCERQRLRTQAEQNEALAAANRMRTALLAAVSHDLRTPLASVKAAVSSLRQRDVAWSDADRDDLLATIEEGADRLGDLIGNLLDMSRIQTGAVQPFLRAISFDEVLPAVIRGVDAARRVDLIVPEDLPLLVTDPVLLERALANVLANALRYSPAGRRPEVVARPEVDGRTLRVDVVDHGPGVPSELRDRVFEPFQQFGDQRNGNGVGLGLAVAKGFLDAVGGRIDAESTPGGGLTMTMRLPLCDAPERQGVAV